MAERMIDLNRFIPNANVPHRGTHISESRQDTILWECEQDFEITDVQPSNPFHRQFPARASWSPQEQVFKVNSGPPRQGTRGQYHTIFRTLGAAAGGGDPDIIIDP